MTLHRKLSIDITPDINLPHIQVSYPGSPYRPPKIHGNIIQSYPMLLSPGIICQYCEIHLSSGSEQDHISICGQVQIECPLQCGTSIKRSELDTHYQSCTHYSVYCSSFHCTRSCTCTRSSTNTHYDKYRKSHDAIHLSSPFIPSSNKSLNLITCPTCQVRFIGKHKRIFSFEFQDEKHHIDCHIDTQQIINEHIKSCHHATIEQTPRPKALQTGIYKQYPCQYPCQFTSSLLNGILLYQYLHHEMGNIGGSGNGYEEMIEELLRRGANIGDICAAFPPYIEGTIVEQIRKQNTNNNTYDDGDDDAIERERREIDALIKQQYAQPSLEIDETKEHTLSTSATISLTQSDSLTDVLPSHAPKPLLTTQPKTFDTPKFITSLSGIRYKLLKPQLKDILLPELVDIIIEYV